MRHIDTCAKTLSFVAGIRFLAQMGLHAVMIRSISSGPYRFGTSPEFKMLFTSSSMPSLIICMVSNNAHAQVGCAILMRHWMAYTHSFAVQECFVTRERYTLFRQRRMRRHVKHGMIQNALVIKQADAA